MSQTSYRVFDADGHVWEHPAEIASYFEGDYQEGDFNGAFSLFPSLDGGHHAMSRKREAGHDMMVDASSWGQMLDDLGAEGGVLYPTAGLALGLINDPDYSVAVSTAYNSWLEERFMRQDPRLKGVGLMSVQDPRAAVKELERCVQDRTNFVAMLLPATPVDHRRYGDEFFWPMYEAAERSNIPLAVHGGSAAGLGGQYAMAIHHPMTIFTNFTDMILNGVFDTFPGLRVAFLEAGCGWAPWLGGLLDEKNRHGRGKAGENIISLLRDSDSIWFSCEVDEPELRHCIDVIGDQHIMYPSDYPHERNRELFCDELDELKNRSDLSDGEKQAILFDNAQRFYGLLEEPI